MFRKEYKQANDNIKVDEALLERTLEAAFSEKPKKKAYYNRSFIPVAAALVIVIGASAAYPKLIKEPAVEQRVTTVTSTVSPTMNPDAELKFEAVPDSAKVDNVSKPNSVASPKSSKNNTSDDIAEPSKVQEGEMVENFDVVSSVDETEISPSSVLPSVARITSEEIPAFDVTEGENNGFSQVSCKFTNGMAEYIYEDESGKSFSVTVTDSVQEPTVEFYIERNEKIYTFSSSNMTNAEILEVFETLNI